GCYKHKKCEGPKHALRLTRVPAARQTARNAAAAGVLDGQVNRRDQPPIMYIYGKVLLPEPAPPGAADCRLFFLDYDDGLIVEAQQDGRGDAHLPMRLRSPDFLHHAGTRRCLA